MVLVGYWPLDEGSGSTAYDHSGNENHGTINDGGDSTVPGAQGILGQNAYSFDGEGDHVRVSDDAALNPANQLTFSVWFKPTEWGDDWNIILDKYDGSSHAYNFQASSDGGSDLEAPLTTGGSQKNVIVQTNISGYLGEWHLISVTYDGARIRAFWDGKLQNGKSASGSLYQSSADLGIGCRSGDCQPNYQFKGQLAELRLYNRALTPQEIQYLYQVGKRGRQVASSKSS